VHAWHDEWWDEESVLEAEGVGPMETVYKSVGLARDFTDKDRLVSVFICEICG
jgi:hypothetical protein